MLSIETTFHLVQISLIIMGYFTIKLPKPSSCDNCFSLSLYTRITCNRYFLYVLGKLHSCMLTCKAIQIERDKSHLEIQV